MFLNFLHNAWHVLLWVLAAICIAYGVLLFLARAANVMAYNWFDGIVQARYKWLKVFRDDMTEEYHKALENMAEQLKAGFASNHNDVYTPFSWISTFDYETINKGPWPNNPPPVANKIEIVLLGVDGNAAFALLGENLQVVESEFETITPTVNAHHAASRAMQRLAKRLLPQGGTVYYKWDKSMPGNPVDPDRVYTKHYRPEKTEQTK